MSPNAWRLLGFLVGAAIGPPMIYFAIFISVAGPDQRKRTWVPFNPIPVLIALAAAIWAALMIYFASSGIAERNELRERCESQAGVYFCARGESCICLAKGTVLP